MSPGCQLMFPPKPAAAWGDAAVVVPWVLYERFGDERRAPRSVRRACEPGSTQIASLAGDDHLWNTGFPARRLARSRCATRSTRRHADRPLPHRHRLPRPHGPPARAHRGGARSRRRRLSTTPSPTRSSPPSIASTSRPRADWPAIRRPRTRWRSRSTCCPTRTSGDGRRSVSSNSSRTTTTASGPDFVGTPLVCDALASHGYLDEAYHLLTQDECPSWLYPVTMGATTIWERWDSMLPGRVDQPRRDDFVQPLRVGSRRRLPASCRRRTGPRRARAIGRSSSALDPEADSPPPPPRSPRRSETHQSHGGATARRSRSTSTVPEGASATVDVDGCPTTRTRTRNTQPDRNLPSGRRRPRAPQTPHTVRRDRIRRSVNVRLSTRPSPASAAASLTLVKAYDPENR